MTATEMGLLAGFCIFFLLAPGILALWMRHVAPTARAAALALAFLSPAGHFYLPGHTFLVFLVLAPLQLIVVAWAGVFYGYGLASGISVLVMLLRLSRRHAKPAAAMAAESEGSA